MPRKASYCRAIVLVHGKSELKLVNYIAQNLRINVKILSRDKGGSSVQVSGLLNFINADTRLKNLKALQKEFVPQEENKKLLSFRFFTIMDLDDWNEKEIEKYKTKEMFKNTWLKEYIYPIWFEPHFDLAMQKTELIKRIPNDKEKGELYSKIFEVKDNNNNGLENVKKLRNKLSKYHKTNIVEFIDYCIKVAEES